MNDSLEKFVSKFEEKFGHLLIVPKKIDRPAIYTRFFLIYNDKPKQKYSDWDVNCWLKSEVVSEENLLEIDKFIRSREELNDIGLLLPMADKHKTHTFHHLDKTRVLHYMGLFLDEQSSPFLDLTIYGVGKRVIQNAFPDSHDEEFESWIMLTAWRKLRNGQLLGNMSEYNQFISDYISLFEGEDLEELKKDEASFFKKSVPERKYAEVIKLLSA